MTHRVRTLTLAGAVAVIVIVFAVVLVFGLRPYPDLPTLAEQPDPPVTGRLAHVEHGPDGPCITVVDGDGSQHELGCGRSLEGELRWIDDGHLGVRRLDRFDGHDAATVDVIDISTGEVVGQRDVVDDPRPGLDPTDADGDRVAPGGLDGTATVELTRADGGRQTLLELEGPQDYAFVEAGWTADGRWVAAQDTIGRVIVIDPAEQVGARIWAEDVGMVVLR